MFNNNYDCEPKGMPLVSYYREMDNVSAPLIFTDLHYHSDFEILYITCGRAKMIVNGQTFYAEKGSLVLINPYEVHYGEILSEEYHFYCIDFDINLLSLPYAERIIKEEMKYVNHINNPDFEEYVRDVFLSYNNEPKGWQLRARGSLLMLFSHLEEKLFAALPSKETEFAKRVINYVDKNYMKNITSKTVADALSYNQSYFCRIFKKSFSIKFSDYLSVLRIKKAKELLKTENVSNAAMLSGFSSISYFSVEFKKQCGISPLEYKKRIK